MAIDQYATHTASPAVASPADLDVPDFMRPDYIPAKPATTAEKPVARPAGAAALVAARATGRGAGTGARWVATGVASAGRKWVEAYHDDYPHMIRVARNELRAAEGTRDAGAAKADVKDWRREHRKVRLQHLGKTGVGTLATTGGMAAGGIILGGWIDIVLALGGVATAAWHGRRVTQAALAAAIPALPIEGGEAPVAGAPELLEALAAIKVPDGAQVLASQAAADGTSITIVNLPPNFTVTSLKAKAEELAGALGRDTTMVDITKAAHANQAAIWVSSRDPFEETRPSPLMDRRHAVDAFLEGVPVAWGKRGNPVLLPVNNSSFVVGGGTRSGKGVGAANLVTGAAFDPRINLRIVAGKNNGEWDPAAKAGVAATYFKPNAHRLNALLKALWADKDRRERILGKAGKSKMTAATIMDLGGIELLVIDELATYTRPGNELRDENLKLLTDLSAVAAAAGILMVLITQYPEVAVIPQALAMNCTTRWAMRVENATQSNAILGEGSAGSGRDASKFDPPRPGLGWLINPFAGVTDLARSFDLDEDVRGEVSMLMGRAAKIRGAAGRLTGQWNDPIEAALAAETGLSSAAGGPEHNGVPARMLHLLDPQQAAAYEALVGCVDVMDALGRDAQVEEMAAKIGMPAERLSELLRAAGAGSTVKVWITDAAGNRNRLNGYRRDDLAALIDRAKSA